MSKGFSEETLNVTESITLSSKNLIMNSDYNKWNSLPIDICDGITCKRIKTPSEYHGFLLRYEKDSLTTKHVNNDEYEILDVRSGSITNITTNEVYHEGDVAIFDKGESHQILCNEEAYVYCIMTKSSSQLHELT